jgi:dimethylhistidine N-methyltransferase
MGKNNPMYEDAFVRRSGRENMGLRSESRLLLADFKPDRERFLGEVVEGLTSEPKRLPCKYLYDERGSLLFERICALDDYYIPGMEREIMRGHLREIAACLGGRVLLVEYGCGDCSKTRLLLDHLDDLAAFVPLDISREQLARVTEELAMEYGQLEILPVCADYTGDFELPKVNGKTHRVVAYYPGSTIGNFEPRDAVDFLRSIAGVCGPGGALLIGVDLKKDPLVLHRAYNDPEGITAAFNLNLLRRINRELDADFDLEAFRHYAFYNPLRGRVEMHLINLREQEVNLGGIAIPLAMGESIWTESSYKYTLEQFHVLASRAGFEVKRAWIDRRGWFSVQYLIGRD